MLSPRIGIRNMLFGLKPSSCLMNRSLKTIAMLRHHVNAPQVNLKKRDKKPEELGQDLQVAVLKMQSESWIEGRLLHLRAQYIE